jgi:outer membrane protein TolC
VARAGRSKALRAAVDAQRYQVEAVYLTLTANLVTTAIREASLRAQLQATREVLQAQREQLSVIEKQFDTGAIPKSTVLQQRTQVAQTQAHPPPPSRSRSHKRATSSRCSPGACRPKRACPSSTCRASRCRRPCRSRCRRNWPASAPTCAPAKHSCTRPAPRRRGHRHLYPQIQLSGSYGNSATRARDLFSGPTTLWSVGAGAHAAALQWRRIAGAETRGRGRVRLGGGAVTATPCSGAFQNVADALRALELDATALQTQATAESLARQSLDLTTTQFRAGAVSYVQLLTAQQAWLQTHTALVQAQAARYADTAALFQALGRRLVEPRRTRQRVHRPGRRRHARSGTGAELNPAAA